MKAEECVQRPLDRLKVSASIDARGITATEAARVAREIFSLLAEQHRQVLLPAMWERDCRRSGRGLGARPAQPRRLAEKAGHDRRTMRQCIPCAQVPLRRMRPQMMKH